MKKFTVISNKTIGKKEISDEMAKNLNYRKKYTLFMTNLIINLCKKNIYKNRVFKVKNFGKFKIIESMSRKLSNLKNVKNNKKELRSEKRKLVKLYYSLIIKKSVILKDFSHKFLKVKNYSNDINNQLISCCAEQSINLSLPEAEFLVNEFFKIIIKNLIDYNRIEIRKLGVFEIRKYEKVKIRDPRNGRVSFLNEKCRPFFKHSKRCGI